MPKAASLWAWSEPLVIPLIRGPASISWRCSRITWVHVVTPSFKKQVSTPKLEHVEVKWTWNIQLQAPLWINSLLHEQRKLHILGRCSFIVTEGNVGSQRNHGAMHTELQVIIHPRSTAAFMADWIIFLINPLELCDDYVQTERGERGRARGRRYEDADLNECSCSRHWRSAITSKPKKCEPHTRTNPSSNNPHLCAAKRAESTTFKCSLISLKPITHPRMRRYANQVRHPRQ